MALKLMISMVLFRDGNFVKLRPFEKRPVSFSRGIFEKFRRAWPIDRLSPESTHRGQLKVQFF